jgi:hypothetical protein
MKKEDFSGKDKKMRELDLKELQKAKKLEDAKKKRGFKYVRVNATTFKLVECDKNGVPTEKSSPKLEKHAE